MNAMTPENRKIAEDIFAEAVGLINPNLRMISLDMYESIIQAMESYAEKRRLIEFSDVGNKIIESVTSINNQGKWSIEIKFKS